MLADLLDANPCQRMSVRTLDHAREPGSSLQVGVHAGAGMGPHDADRPMLRQEIERALPRATCIEEDDIPSAAEARQPVRAVLASESVCRVTVWAAGADADPGQSPARGVDGPYRAGDGRAAIERRIDMLRDLGPLDHDGGCVCLRRAQPPPLRYVLVGAIGRERDRVPAGKGAV